MTTLARLTLAMLAAATALAPRLAAACGATPSPFVTLVEGLPTSRTGLPRDGAVVIRGKEWGPSGGPSNIATLRMLDGVGAEIPGVFEVWYSSEPSIAFRPRAPLPARARFTVEAVARAAEQPRPPEAVGPTTMSLQLEVGDDLAPPLTLAGPMQITLETFEVPAVSCTEPFTGGCGPVHCVKQPARRALRARVKVPAASGGVDFDGYRGWLFLTDDTPGVLEPRGAFTHAGSVNAANWIDVRSGEALEVLVGIVEGERPYAPCFALKLWDPAGHAVEAPSVCLPSFKVSEKIRALDGDSAGGCSFVSGAGRRSTALSLISLAAAFLFLARRRRAC